MKKTAMLFLPLMFLVLGACQAGRTTVEESSPAGAVPEDLTVRFVYQVVEGFREAYLARDVEGFMKNVSEGFYRGRSRMQELLEQEFAAAGGMALEIEIGEVTVEEDRITTVVRWTLGQDGDPERVRTGETLMIFHRSDTIKLVDCQRDCLFGIQSH